MMRWLVAVAVMVAAPLGAARAAAERALDLLDAPVPYTAEFYVSSAKGTYRGSVWHAPGRQRRDFDTQGGGQTILLRRDTDSAYLLKPSGRWYVGLGFKAVGALAGGLDKLVVDRQPMGEDKVAGMRATRYKIAATGPKGSRFDGDAWFTREGIMVKAAGVAVAPDGQRQEVETGLNRLKLGKVDERMFELPSGYFGMDLRSVPAERLEQAVEGLRPMLEGR